MAWFSQSWIWVALAVAIALFVFRGRLGGRSGGRPSDSDRSMLGHMGHGVGEGQAGIGGEQVGDSSRSAPEAAIDPVGGEPVRTASALTSVYQEKIYYFTSKDNRDRFEAAPQDFAKETGGYPVNPPSTSGHGRHRGC
jgi:YHS domain-containing protein